MPWSMIEAVVRLVVLILEGIPVEQRRANALLWWGIWWPVLKPLVPEPTRSQIEDTMKDVK